MKNRIKLYTVIKQLHCVVLMAACAAPAATAICGDRHDHEEHAEGAGGERALVPVTKAQVERFGIKIATASKGTVDNVVSAPGEITFNGDRVIHIVPRVVGIVHKVIKQLGDKVDEGESLAVIESRELADAKSEYLADKARLSLAEKSFAREKTLRDKQVSSEQDYIESEMALEQAQIELRSARQKLHALGLTASAVDGLDTEKDDELTRFEIRSPISGVVTEKHVSPGESLKADAGIFTIADLSSVWVDLAISPEGVPSVQQGQSVTLRLPDGSKAETKIRFVSPAVSSETRTVLARADLDNRAGTFRPGTFVEAAIHVPSGGDAVVIPRASIQLVHDHPCVFVWRTGAFELREVETGASDDERIEIIKGLELGEKVAAVNAFHLKAEYIRSAAGNLGGHQGHSH